MITQEIHIADPIFKATAYQTYVHLRTHSPIQQVLLPDGRSAWLITRYDDVITVLKDQRFSSSPRNNTETQSSSIFATFPPLAHTMLTSDPPDHTRLRKLVSQSFTPRRVEALRPRIQLIVDTLLDKVQHKGSMELISEFAFPLPITVICEMLGVPSEDHDMIHAWSSTITSFIPTVTGSPEAVSATEQFFDYLRKLVNDRSELPSDDLISGLITAEDEGDRLSENEVLGMIWLLLVAGHETTVNLISNGIFALIQHPNQMDLLKDNPSLIKSAVEEFLRYDSPVETSLRFATEDVHINGQVITKGEMLIVSNTAPNRDTARFPDAEQLDITRTNNRHLAFGQGIHYCLGAPLARLEGEIAIRTLIQRMPNIQLDLPLEQLTWRPSVILRGFERLPITF